MTVCVAGMMNNDTIIAVCDMMISTEEFAADSMALKFRDLHGDWKAMFAGNDVSRIIPFLRRANQKLGGSQKRTLVEVENAMRETFHEELVQKQTDLVLARYGLTMESFLDTGLQRFGETLFSAMKYQMDQIDLGCCFLVFGTDTSGDAHIFTVEDPGVIYNHDLYGFWAIGSGGNRALSSLFFQEYRQALPEWQALYYILEAKFMAEGGSVGSDTLVMIRRADGNHVGSLGCEGPKKLWDAKGRPRIPSEAEANISKYLADEMLSLEVPKQSS